MSRKPDPIKLLAKACEIVRRGERSKLKRGENDAIQFIPGAYVPWTQGDSFINIPGAVTIKTLHRCAGGAVESREWPVQAYLPFGSRKRIDRISIPFEFTAAFGREDEWKTSPEKAIGYRATILADRNEQFRKDLAYEEECVAKLRARIAANDAELAAIAAIKFPATEPEQSTARKGKKGCS